MANIAEVRISRIRVRTVTTALALLAAFGLAVAAVPSAKGQSLSVLYSFTGPPDGFFIQSTLIMDNVGNLYGTTGGGGASSNCPSGCGTVFKLDTAGNETVLYSFTGPSGDGAFPVGGLIMDTAGNLYGTTATGGGSSVCSGGCGTLFKLDTAGNETVLHSFTGGDGNEPDFVTLIMDKKGNLYGTTFFGGAGTCSVSGFSGCGTVFKLDTSGNETVLHSFTNSGGDGVGPDSGLIMDKAGKLYGTTFSGGTSSNCSGGCGTVFKLDTSGHEVVLHSFAGGDGAVASAALIIDKSRSLYGTTIYGGSSTNCVNGALSGCGVVFKLDTAGNETVLHSFIGPPTDGYGPYARLIMDTAGNLYGTTASGGGSSVCSGGCGTVFKLDTAGNETVLHSFTGSDGAGPLAGLIMDTAGNLYGTTQGGGTFGFGTVFKLIP